MVDASGAAVAMLKNEGNLTIKDSVDGGKLSFNSTTPSAANTYASNTITNHGTLTIESGIIENTTVGGACYALDNYAGSTATINGGKLVAEKTAVRVIHFATGAAVKSVLNINDGEILSKAGYGLILVGADETTVELNITGGKISTEDTTYNLAVYVNHKTNAKNLTVNVTGGEFDGQFYLNGVTCDTMTAGNIAITDGIFENVSCGKTPAYGFITGGTFGNDVTAFCAEGYKAEQNTDGTYSIAVVPVYVAKNLTTNVSYTSVAAAMMAARAGETVQMIADSVEEASVVVMMNGATLDLNGFDLTAAGLVAFNGNYVVDSSAATTGLLIVPQTNLTLPKNNTELPFWNESNGYYFVSPNTSGYQRFTEQTADGFRFAFRPAFGMIDGQSAGDSREKYIAANGLNDNAISLVLKLRWVGSQGQTVTQEFVYTDELIKTAYNSGSLNITMSNLPVDEIDVQVVLVSETGVEFCGEIATYRAP